MKSVSYPSFIPLMFMLAWLCTACRGGQETASQHVRSAVDSLNTLAYQWHYRDVDSVRECASRAYALADSIHYEEGLAEAMNNLAFERFQQMDFDSAQVMADEIRETTSDAVELLVADVMQMKVSQRTSDNLAFFRHRSHALQRIGKLERREKRMTARRRRRFNYARADLHIVASTYFYYLDQQERAIAEIRAAESYCQLPEDTAQWLYYCYMRGSGGLSERSGTEAITIEEFDYLLPCFWLARRAGYIFFEANVEQSLAMLFADSVRLEVVREMQPEVVSALTQHFGSENTAMTMAESAYNHFVAYDDLYQQACALRTLGELSFDDGRYGDAIRYYAQALACVNFHHQCYYAPEDVLAAAQPDLSVLSECDLLQTYNPMPESESVERRWMRSSSVRTVPEWIAGIRQQLSVAFSALDMRAECDYNRNIYLDLLDVTREDAEFESRAAELQNESQRLRRTWAAVALAALLFMSFILYLLRHWRRRTQMQNRLLRQKIQQIRETARQQQAELEEEQELLREQQAATELRLVRDKQQNIEKRAKLQLAGGIQPYLNRMIHEVERMQQRGETSQASLHYISELANRINDYNNLLTEWIQMEQGQLSLQITSFALEPLFDAIRHSRFAYEQKGLTLDVTATDFSVKADRALTLFMLNTLADNARKFTPEGGNVSIMASYGESNERPYVELSVQDTGCGLSSDDVNLILNNKVYDAAKVGSTDDVSATNSQKGYGFGLMNCKGIIEKYRKTGPLFGVCAFGIESTKGKGSRFWFRLPRVMMLLAVVIALAVPSAPTLAAPSTLDIPSSPFPREAYVLADSVYACNLTGRYAEALILADSAFRVMRNEGQDDALYDADQLSMSENGKEPVEYQWFHRQAAVDYSILLGLRNEVAVAALALHDWPLYRYNNRVYSRLFKLTNQDTTLEAYCQQTEHSHANERLAIIVLVIIFVLGAAAFDALYIHPHVLFRRKLAALKAEHVAQLQRKEEMESERRQTDFELAEDEHRRRLYEENRLHVQNQIIDNCLSTIKHETMYYPGRIEQLVDRLQDSNSSDDAGALLATLGETITYYREIHGLLTAQASSQSEALNFRRRRQTFTDLTSSLPKHVASVARQSDLQVALTLKDNTTAALVRCDSDLITYLLTELIDYEVKLIASRCGQTSPSQNGFQPSSTLTLALTGSTDGRFMCFTLTNPCVTLSDAELHDFFMPHEGGVPPLICKQVIREHDTFLGHPGCRINAERVGEGHAVWFTIPIIY